MVKKLCSDNESFQIYEIANEYGLMISTIRIFENLHQLVICTLPFPAFLAGLTFSYVILKRAAKMHLFVNPAKKS